MVGPGGPRRVTAARLAGVPPLEQNARIRLPDGRHYIADFLWRELRAVLEIDSYEFHSLPGDADRTSARHIALETSASASSTARRRLLAGTRTVRPRDRMWLGAVPPDGAA